MRRFAESPATINVIVPRILGHATDLLFNGVIGRGLPEVASRPVVITPPTCAPEMSINCRAKIVDFTAVEQVLALALWRCIWLQR